jgi:hypothetical protein
MSGTARISTGPLPAQVLRVLFIIACCLTLHFVTDNMARCHDAWDHAERVDARSPSQTHEDENDWIVLGTPAIEVAPSPRVGCFRSPAQTAHAWFPSPLAPPPRAS